MPSDTDSSPSWLQFLIVLAEVKPLVWRRIVVPSTYSFWDLHVAIQDAMGWNDCHLHSFRLVDPRSSTLTTLGIPDPDAPGSLAVLPGWSHRLDGCVTYDQPPILYSYDFADGWQHAVVFEGYAVAPDSDGGPVCLGGASACPPEDCGGPGGYALLIEALADSEHERHDELAGWFGDRPLDPYHFAVREIRFDDPKRRWKLYFGDGEA